MTITIKIKNRGRMLRSSVADGFEVDYAQAAVREVF
jgi:hypothetical protein